MLLLKAVEVAGDNRRWRWLLTDERTGAPLADHQVVIDPAEPEVEAFTDLYRHLRWNADPDRRVESEGSIVDRVGRWAGERILGNAIGAAIVKAAPVTVRVQAPGFLLSAPLELAHVGGVPLARRGDVTLVYDIGDPTVPAPTPRDHLRMVAVFSLPTETTALALRRERYELSRLVRQLAARARRTIRLEVLQYGVTRAKLLERMTESGGPDVLHLSGHGATGLVLLETDDGRPDPVPMDELLNLLSPAKGRLRLAVLSACQSAAVATAETLRWLKLDEAADQAQQRADADLDDQAAQAGVAQRIARQIGCAVIAMRYPVVDDFAIKLSGSLYEGLYTLDLPLDRALARAIPAAAAGSMHSPAVSIATPTVLGAAAIGMSLTPPKGPLLLDPAEQTMAAFPEEPPRFVGRAAAMARASRAIASGSGQSGVLFHGMAGAGKTSCALELAYRHNFAHALWWQAPLREDEWPHALTNLAMALEDQLSDHGFTMVDKLEPQQAFRRFLPRLRGLLRDNGLLLVLDNLETLLTDTGGWRDPRWAELVDTLTGHGGESRAVLTSRIRPAKLSSSVQVEPVHALSRDEAVLLARELPNLRRLLHAEPGPTRLSQDADRAQVRRILHLVQGHPKLLELADAAAADPQTLAAHLKDDGREDTLTAFLAHGESTLDDVGFLGVLATWTRTTMATLPPPSQLLLQMLAGLEDDDRWSYVLEVVWVAPPDLAAALAPLTAAALVDPQPVGDAGVRYRLHPGVAEAIRAATPDAVRTELDLRLGDFWYAVAWQREGGEHTEITVRAGLAGAVYLMRQQRWDNAIYLIEQALNRDSTVAVAQRAVAYLRRIAEATGTPDAFVLMGVAAARIDPVEGERLLHAALGHAAAGGDHRRASVVIADLIVLYRDSGRLSEALDLVDRKAEYARQAGLGPWTQLGDEVRRLQILALQGQVEDVLAQALQLRDRMAQLPDPPAVNDAVDPWKARESILHLAAYCARQVGRWQESLDLNAIILAGLRVRGAGEHAIVFELFNDYGPLLNLGRYEEADRLLRVCQHGFEAHNDLSSLAKTLSARATLAAHRGSYRAAVDLQHTALRLNYLRPEPEAIGLSHYNLAAYFARAGLEPAGQVAHWLAAVTIYQLTGQAAALARVLHVLAGASPPVAIADLAAEVEQVEGVKFTELVVALAGDLDTAQQALDSVLRDAGSQA